MLLIVNAVIVAFAETAGKVGLAINEQKTEVMEVGEDPPQVNLNGKNLGLVERFTYVEAKYQVVTI